MTAASPASAGAVSPEQRSDHAEPTVFSPRHVVHRVRELRNLAAGPATRVCLLDPDGDIADFLVRTGKAYPCPQWACFHTRMLKVPELGIAIVDRAVGGPFAVMVAEQLFATGCQLLIHIGTAGALDPAGAAGDRFRVVARTLRGDGVSYAYLPADAPIVADADMLDRARDQLAHAQIHLPCCTAWTTDAPFRETPTAIRNARTGGADVVDMESAGLLAFSQASGNNVLCVVNITNAVHSASNDFEKGADNGVGDALRIVRALSSGADCA